MSRRAPFVLSGLFLVLFLAQEWQRWGQPRFARWTCTRALGVQFDGPPSTMAWTVDNREDAQLAFVDGDGCTELPSADRVAHLAALAVGAPSRAVRRRALVALELDELPPPLDGVLMRLATTSPDIEERQRALRVLLQTTSSEAPDADDYGDLGKVLVPAATALARESLVERGLQVTSPDETKALEPHRLLGAVLPFLSDEQAFVFFGRVQSARDPEAVLRAWLSRPARDTALLAVIVSHLEERPSDGDWDTPLQRPRGLIAELAQRLVDVPAPAYGALLWRARLALSRDSLLTIGQTAWQSLPDAQRSELLKAYAPEAHVVGDEQADLGALFAGLVRELGPPSNRDVLRHCAALIAASTSAERTSLATAFGYRDARHQLALCGISFQSITHEDS